MKWRLILIFFVGSVALRGQTEASLKDRLSDCVDTYLRHINYFMATDTKTKPELPTQFQALFVSGVHVSPPFGDATAQWTPLQYGQWLLGFSDNAKLVQEQLRFCKSAAYPDVWEIYVLQRFVGAYLEPKPHELPRLGQILSVQVGADGTFLIADIEPMPVSLYHDLDSDHDGIPDRADACPWLAGGLERNGAHPFKPCPKDADGDGTLDKDDKCPNQFGEKEDGGCPTYSKWGELDSLEKLQVINLKDIQEAKKNGTESFELDRVCCNIPSAINKLTALKKLTTSYASIRDLKILKDLKLLRKLHLFRTQVDDPSGFNELTQLTKISWSEGRLKNLDMFKNLLHLDTLELHILDADEQLTDLSPPAGLKSLTSLTINGGKISNISGLKSSRKLQALNLSGNKISDLSALRELKQLTTLNLSLNKISDLSALRLRELKQLTTLYLCSNQIIDISALRELNQLTTLNLYENQISNISALREFKQLTTLDLNHNKISDLSSLRDLKQLTTLNLGFNQIGNISTLRELKQLTTLDLWDNQISDISALRELKQLTTLWLPYNKIQNFNLDLSLFPNLTELYLWGNPIQNIPKEIIGTEYNNCADKLREYQKTKKQ